MPTHGGCKRELDELLIFKQHFHTISHCYREVNAPADRLVNFSADCNAGQVFDRLSDLSRLVRRDIRMDKLGCPSFHRRVIGYL